MSARKTQVAKGEISPRTGSARPARILIADDHPIFRQGMAALLNCQRDLVCCGEAASLAETLRAVAAHKPDLLLLDLRMGATDGLDAIKTIKAQFPRLRILMLSQFDETLYADRTLRAGASGYVMKEQASDEVLRAIHTVLGGQLYVSPAISMLAVTRMLQDKSSVRGSNLSALSDRELNVFRALGAGKGNKQIAAEMNLSVKTIETYREHIKYKLGLATGAELVHYARNVAEAEIVSGTRSAA